MKAEYFKEKLERQGITAYYGVPDSLLKSFCAYIKDNVPAEKNIIAANEGNAIGLACGHYLATGRPALVYMQNSGQGNCVNPLLSLMDEAVYSIPVLLLIGWRGEPGVKDEPQHITQGRLTLPLLETMDIPYDILSDDEQTAAEQINAACTYMQRHKKAYALVVRKDTFEPYVLKKKRVSEYEMSREQAICAVAAAMNEADTVVATTGHISRELYEYRTRSGSSHSADFLTVGGMGHASSIAMGIALNRPERRIVCMDGDGAFIMHMGAAALVGNSGLRNFRHIVFNNAAHDSVGGQPTVADKVELEQLARACGYVSCHCASTEAELQLTIPGFLKEDGPSLLEIKVRTGARSDLGRPKTTPVENKRMFMSFLEEGHARVYPGALSSLASLIHSNDWKNILLFSTERRLASLGKFLEGAFEGCHVDTYTDMLPNPRVEDVERAIAQISGKYDAIVAIGGGSCIDFAKLYRVAKDNTLDIRRYFRTPSPLVRKTPLVAVPTTAGTGSEATRFAVVYIEGEKYSLDDAAVMPDYALVDCLLMKDAPQYLKASCGMDAFAQAIEGYWANGASRESDNYAKEAIMLCRDNLKSFVLGKSSASAEQMAKASYLAGKCISISRTTAAHALSYKITQLYGIPHGHAVSLSLPGLLELHHDMAHSGTPLRNKMQWLEDALSIGSNGFRRWFYDLYEQIGIIYNPADLGIKDIRTIVEGVNTQRLSNNPIALTTEQLMGVFFPPRA